MKTVSFCLLIFFGKLALGIIKFIADLFYEYQLNNVFSHSHFQMYFVEEIPEITINQFMSYNATR